MAISVVRSTPCVSATVATEVPGCLACRLQLLGSHLGGVAARASLRRAAASPRYPIGEPLLLDKLAAAHDLVQVGTRVRILLTVPQIAGSRGGPHRKQPVLWASGQTVVLESAGNSANA